MSPVLKRPEHDSVVSIRRTGSQRQIIGRIVFWIYRWRGLLRRRMRLPLRIVVPKQPGDQVRLAESYVPDVVADRRIFCVLWSATGLT